jgi:BlaI family penicillinase repressor
LTDNEPSPRELDVLKALWALGSGSVREVHRRMYPDGELAFNTVQTLLRIMEEKGFIAHENRGRVFVFTPLISRKAIDKLSIQSLLSHNFGGSPTGLFVNLLEAARVKEKDLDELEAQIREYRKKSESNGRARG